MSQDTHTSKNINIFVHGIGTYTKGRLPLDSTTLTQSIPDSASIDFCWSELTAKPTSFYKLSSDYLLQLGRALITSAYLGFKPGKEDHIFKTINLALSNISATVFYLITLISPILFYLVWVLRFGEAFMRTEYMYVTMLILKISALSSILSILFAQLAMGGSSGFLTAIRRLLILAIWPVVCLAVAGATYSRKMLFTIAILAGIPAVLGVGNALMYQFENSIAAITAILSLLPAVLIVTIIRWVIAKYSEQLKLMGDIFFYLGNETYREKLLEAFDHFVAEHVESKEQRVVFITHSLGSVIATAYLLKSVYLIHNPVCLITMGSPLRRLFFRFFPLSMNIPEDIAMHIGQKYRYFKWVNIYRPFDFIGGSLSSKSSSLIRNISTGQYRDPFTSHTGYWRDEKVGRIIARSGVHSFDEKPFISVSHSVLSIVPSNWNLGWVAWSAALVLLFIYPVWYSILVRNIYGPRHQLQVAEKIYAYLEQKGITTEATVKLTYKRVTVDQGDGVSFDDHFYLLSLKFETHSDSIVEQQINGIDWIDEHRLIKSFRNKKTIQDSYKLSIYKYDPLITPLIYHSRHSKLFMLNEFKIDEHSGPSGFKAFVQTVFGALFSFTIIFLLFGNVITALCGLPPFSFVESFKDWLEDFGDSY